MKNKIYLLFSLMVLVSMATVSSADAQHRGGFYRGGGRTRVSVGIGIGGPGFYGGYYHYAPRPYYYYRPYYHYYGPPIGFRVGVLPYGFLTFNTAWGPYYYSDGFFYQPYAGSSSSSSSEQYQVVDPPMGVVIPKLPNGSRQVEINGNTYYEKNGTLYQEVMQNNVRKYVVVGKDGQLETDENNNNNNSNQQDNAAPVQGDVMATLPEGSRGVEINGQQLYVSPDGMYYQEVINSDNSRGYKVVGKMSADN